MGRAGAQQDQRGSDSRGGLEHDDGVDIVCRDDVRLAQVARLQHLHLEEAGWG
jgi:hypothetical protein